MIPVSTQPSRSPALVAVYSQLDLTSREKRVVIDPNDLPSLEEYVKTKTVNLYRFCVDNDHNIPRTVINEQGWKLLNYCDYKLFANSSNNILQLALLDKFLLNSQPLKILHISLDQKDFSAFELMENVKNLTWRNKLCVEINDRTETISTWGQARTLTKHLLMDKLITCYYWNSKLNHWGGYGLDLSDSNSQPEYY